MDTTTYAGLLKEKPTQTIDMIAKQLYAKQRKVKSAGPRRFKSPAQA